MNADMMVTCSFSRAVGNDKAQALSLARAVVAQVPSSGRAHFLVVRFCALCEYFSAALHITTTTNTMKGSFVQDSGDAKQALVHYGRALAQQNNMFGMCVRNHVVQPVTIIYRHRTH